MIQQFFQTSVVYVCGKKKYTCVWNVSEQSKINSSLQNNQIGKSLSNVLIFLYRIVFTETNTKNCIIIEKKRFFIEHITRPNCVFVNCVRIPRQSRALCSFSSFVFSIVLTNVIMFKGLSLHSRDQHTLNEAPFQCKVWPRNATQRVQTILRNTYKLNNLPFWQSFLLCMSSNFRKIFKKSNLLIFFSLFLRLFSNLIVRKYISRNLN